MSFHLNNNNYNTRQQAYSSLPAQLQLQWDLENLKSNKPNLLLPNLLTEGTSSSSFDDDKNDHPHHIQRHCVVNTPTMMSAQLHAASVVSFENTPDAHEYQPQCRCGECQSMFRDSTKYAIMDEYVLKHLPYEQHIKRTYGYIPCVDGKGGERGKFTVQIDVDPRTQEPILQEKRGVITTNPVFHMHVHEMGKLSHNFRERSLMRYYGTFVPPAQPKKTSHVNHHDFKPQQQQEQPMQPIQPIQPMQPIQPIQPVQPLQPTKSQHHHHHDLFDQFDHCRSYRYQAVTDIERSRLQS